MPITIGGVIFEKITIDGTELDKVTVDGVTVFEAVPTYTIRVVANGSATEYLIKEGELARTVVPYVSRDGWMFYGWFEYQRDDMDFDPDSTYVYQNYTIYAKWWREVLSGTCSTCSGTGETTTTEMCGTCDGEGGYTDTCDNCNGGGYGYGWQSCETCYGLGYIEGEWCGSCGGDTCSDCNWSGYALCTTCEGNGGYNGYGDCPSCSGTGEKYYYCDDCDGGYITETGTCGNCSGSGKVYTTEYEYY